MKVALVIDTWFPFVGGGQINAWEISRRLAKKGVSIDIITRDNGRYHQKKIKNIRIFKLGPMAKADDTVSKITFSFRVFNFLNNRDYDLIHVHPFLPALPVKLIGRMKKTPVIMTVHGTRLFEEPNPLLPAKLLEKFILTQVKYNLQISLTKAFLKIKNVNSNVVTIPNGINLKEFDSVKVAKSPHPKILWVGRFDPVKKVEDLLFAFKKIKQKISKTHLYLVGYGYQKEKIKNLREKLGLRDVHFLGLIEGKDLIREYKTSHVFVLPSSSEGQPLVLLEAMAAGLPVVATKTGGVPELVKDGFTGFLVPPGSPQKIADAILKILSAKSSFKEENFKYSLKNHDWQEIAKQTLASYKRVLSP